MMMTPQWSQKEHLMIQNLNLLGIQRELVKELDRKHDSCKKSTSNSSKLMPGMFNLPNERMLLNILYHLLLHIQSDQREELQYCWPFVTLQDKSIFKRKAQVMLQELERQGYLPVGSSQVSRIATGHGPRVIDLVWRLSTYVIKKKLEKDFEAYTYVKAPGDSGYSNLKDFKRAPEIIAATQNIIAFKTHKFKKDCAERVGIQEQWVSFAQTITNQMQEFSHVQRKLEEEQTKSPATSQTKILTTLDEAERKASMEKIQRGWDSIKMFAEADWNKDGQKIIEISTEYADCRPRLNGSSMQKNNCLGVVDRKTDLPDLVGEFKNFIATAQTYLKHVDFEGFVKLADVTSEGSTINDLRRYASCTKIIMEQLQAAVVKVKSNNDLDKRETCIRLATRPTTGMINKLCPLAPQDVLTPQKLVLSTQKDQDEASLVDSLKKITMNQLSEITANCVREAARKNRAADSSQEVIMQLQDSRPADSDHIGEIDGIVARRLDYDN